MVELTRVYNEVAALSSSSKQECEAASRFLDEFQRSTHAWSACNQILNDAQSLVVCTFAAQTMRRKMVSDFRELDPASYTTIRQSLLNHLCVVKQKFDANTQPIVTQLAVALIDLYLQVPEWNEFGVELFNQFANLTHSDERYTQVLLELLKVFPEELQNKSIRIGENRRKVVQRELAALTPSVLSFLEMVCQTNENFLEKTILVFGAWMSNSSCPSDSIANSHFYRSVLMALQSPECRDDVHAAAATAVSNVLAFCENLSQCRELAIMTKDALLQTVPAFDYATNAEDHNKLASYGRLYADLCAMLLEPIINTPNEGIGDLRCLDLLLRAAQHHDYTIVGHAFEIWYQLSEALYYLDELEFEEKRELFRPYVERYVLMLYQHCRFDMDTERMPSPNDEFVEFRTSVFESIKDVAFVIGSLNIVEKIVHLMLASDSAWNEIESGLFIIKSAAGNIVTSDTSITPQLLNLVLRVPVNSNKILVVTSIELIGELNEWLAEQPEKLNYCMRWLLSVPMDDVAVWRPMATALQKLATRGYMHLGSFFDSILALLQAVEHCNGPFAELEDAAQELLKANACLLNDRPSAEIQHLLGLLLSQPLEQLDKICTNQIATASNGSGDSQRTQQQQSWQQQASDPLVWLDRITCMYRMLKPWKEQAACKQVQTLIIQRQPSHALQAAATEPIAWFEHSVVVWRKLAEVFDRFANNTRVMEHCCRTTRFVIRSMSTQSSIFIGELAEKLVAIYAEHPHSCILYLCGIVVDEYGKMSELEGGLIGMLKVLTPRALQLIDGPDGARSQPETVDDLFRLACRCCYRMPAAFFNESVAEQLMQSAVVNVELDHQEANKSIVQFLTEVLSLGATQSGPPNFKPTVDRVNVLIHTYGELLLWHCLHGSIYVLSAHLRYDVARIIKSLIQIARSNSLPWLESCVEKLPRDSGLSATSEQLMELATSLKKCDTVQDVTSELSELIRLYT